MKGTGLVGNLPENLTPLLPVLFNNLVGCAPLNRFTADSRSWGGKPFSVKEGYSHLLSNLPGFPTSKIWKEIWSGPSLPKVNALCWLLAHGKILTAENLLKWGIQGPSRCPLCLEASETINHLFLECNFSLQLWSLIYLPLPNISPLPDNWTTLLTHWKQRYSGSFKNKKGFTLLWKQIPKFVTWEIWVARNQAIFRGKSPSVNISFAKICGITSEVFRNKAIDLDPPGILDSSEEGWVKYIRGPMKNKATSQVQASRQSNWQLRLDDNNFSAWQSQQHSHLLFFDGATTGNPGVAGGGGSSMIPREIS
jgi:hypothetical protein